MRWFIVEDRNSPRGPAAARRRASDYGQMATAGRAAGGFWGQLPEREKELLQTAGRNCIFPPGATVCAQGDPATHVFVLISGWVKVVAVAGGGQQTVLALRGDGDVVGEVAGEVTGFRTATVKAIGRVRSIVLPHTRFAAFLDANPAAARAYRHALTRRWNDTAESLRIQSISSGAERLARLLLDLALNRPALHRRVSAGQAQPARSSPASLSRPGSVAQFRSRCPGGCRGCGPAPRGRRREAPGPAGEGRSGSARPAGLARHRPR